MDRTVRDEKAGGTREWSLRNVVIAFIIFCVIGVGVGVAVSQ